ncbi:ogr/Delta-like zinc finger family protein [Pseudomonas sp. MPG01]
MISLDELSLDISRRYCQCSSVKCGHTWVANHNLSHTPNPSVKAVERLLFDRLRTIPRDKQRDFFERLG